MGFLIRSMHGLGRSPKRIAAMFGLDVWIVLGLVIVVLAGAGAVVRRRRARRRSVAGKDTLYPTW
jgi:hypothetical protein